MAIHVRTSDPSGLLSAIRQSIDDGKIKTWSYDKDGDFTHTADQWINLAWLRPSISDDKLTFNTVPPRTQHISIRIYGVYHGRFIEMLLSHFDDKFTRASATAQASNDDQIRGQDTPS